MGKKQLDIGELSGDLISQTPEYYSECYGPKDVHVSNPGTWDYDISHRKRDFADMNKLKILR